MPNALAVATFPSVLELMGVSPSAERSRRVVLQASQHNRPVLLTAESGLDVVAVARAIHDASSRASGLFVVVDCGSREGSSIDHKLFGAHNGATGGSLEQLGEDSFLGSALGGTFVMANLPELPSPLQVRLARVLRDRQVHRVPERASPLDVLLVATARGNLEDQIRDG